MKTLLKSVLFLFTLFGANNSFAQVPILNSYPSASPVIFLDFDGHTVDGTYWNTTGTIYCGPSNLSSAQITEVFNRIAEDYRPFNLNITTDSTKYWSAPATQRSRIIFTITYEWYGNTAGGVAYTGSFSWGNNNPAFVFTSLHNYNVKNIAEAGAHEGGHTLGLRHQATYDANCNLTSYYNSGNGLGETSWAPIMGVGYSRNVTTWYNGPNTFGCSNIQPDLEIITSDANGITFKSDDISDDFANAQTVSFSNGQFNTNGMITTSTDVDVYKISLTGTKRLKFNAIPTSFGAGEAGSNLNLSAKLYNQSNQLIQDYDNEQVLSASIDTTLSPGTYYIMLDAVGSQYIAEYGSLGSYAINAEQIPISILDVSKFELKGNSENGVHKLDWILEAEEGVKSQVIEISSNGKDFTKLSDLNKEAKRFGYRPEAGSVIYYRISITLMNNQQYYSNVIAMRNNGNTNKPKLITNVVASNSLMIISPADYQYTLNDYNGRVITKGQVIKGSSTINTNYLSAGAYMIRFVNGNDQYVEKFLKQ